MLSIRAKITLLTLSGVFVSMLAATIAGAVSISKTGNESTEKLLNLTCEAGEKDIDYYFESVEQSVEVVSTFIKADLEITEMDHFGEHIERAKDFFFKTVAKTKGVLTYYYRIDPTVSTSDIGFWFIEKEGEGFFEHEPTDITQYDTSDTTKLVWYTVPKVRGESIWISPYYTDNFGAYVVSYNVPVYRQGEFVGVVGIEIDYFMIDEQVQKISLYNDGYGYIADKDGQVYFHPHYEGASFPEAPKEALGERRLFSYYFQGVERVGVWMPLRNGMRLIVSVPVSEINGTWQWMIAVVVMVGIGISLGFGVLSVFLAKRITDPLRKVIEAANQLDDGNYDISLKKSGTDEIAVLNRSVTHLAKHLKGYISDLSSRAYEDALTGARNKGAFDVLSAKIEKRIDNHDDLSFGALAFDCDDLKLINDHYGHDKGDLYLKEAYKLIASAFPHSPVFRIGGDEFTVLLQDGDYANREELVASFRERMEENNSKKQPWERPSISMGLSVYDPENDRFVFDVTRRADRLMYEDKRTRKAARQD